MTSFLILLLAAAAFSVNIVIHEKPSDYQLYPRNDANLGHVVVRGALLDTTVDTLSAALLRNGRPFSRTALGTVFSNDSFAFRFSLPIHAELAEYSLRVHADTALVLKADSLVAGDAYIINGQSNALTLAGDGDIHEYCRTLSGATQQWKISERGNTAQEKHVGTWGQIIAFSINRDFGIPVFMVNGAASSMPITSFLPGSLNPAYPYGDVLNRTILAGLKDAVKGVFWYQGEADCVESAVPLYASRFDQLYKAWKRDYPGLQKIFVFQLGAAGGNGWGQKLKEIQRNFQTTYPDVRVMATFGSPQGTGHWGRYGYVTIGEKMFRLVARDIYGSTDTVAIHSPDIRRAYYSSAARDRVTLQFDQPTFFRDSLGLKLADFFYLDGISKVVDSGWHEPAFNRVILKLKAPSTATRITYLPDWADSAGNLVMGPFLFNARPFMGAFSFCDVPIESALAPDTAAPQALDLTAPKNELLRFESVRLSAVARYGSGSADTNAGVAFESLDPFAAQVLTDGKVRGFNPGTARIVARKGALADTFSLTVNPGFTPLAGLTFIRQSRTLRNLLPGDSLPFGVRALVAEGPDTLAFFADTLATVRVPAPQLMIRGAFIHAVQAGGPYSVTAEAAGLRCTTDIHVTALPAYLKRINFQAANAPVSAIPGWFMENTAAYSQTRGMGWISPSGLTAYSLSINEVNYFKRTMIRTVLSRTAVKAEQTYRVDAPAGRYILRVANINLFYCQDTSYVRHGNDTVLSNPICNYMWDYDMAATRRVTIAGDSGLILKVYGTLCYLVLASEDCEDFNLIARDWEGPITEPPASMALQDPLPASGLSEAPCVYPNPFNPAASIRFRLPAGVRATVRICDIRGRAVRQDLIPAAATVMDRHYRIDFAALRLASGFYFLELSRSDRKSFTRKLVFAK